MKLEKHKVFGSVSLSTTAKFSIATSLGMATLFTLNACDDSTSAASNDEPQSSSSKNTLVEDNPASSSQTEGPASSSQPDMQSSSSKILDIPLSQEPVSSEAFEALSSAAESSSSQIEPQSSSDTPESSSSEFDHYQGTCPNGPTSPDCNIQFCDTPDGPCYPIVSMVTTFERDDIVG